MIFLLISLYSLIISLKCHDINTCLQRRDIPQNETQWEQKKWTFTEDRANTNTRPLHDAALSKLLTSFAISTFLFFSPHIFQLVSIFSLTCELSYYTFTFYKIHRFTDAVKQVWKALNLSPQCVHLLRLINLKRNGVDYFYFSLIQWCYIFDHNLLF